MSKELRLAQVVIGAATGTGGIVIGTANVAGVTTVVALSTPVAITAIVVGGVALVTCFWIGNSVNRSQSISVDTTAEEKDKALYTTVTTYINTDNKSGLDISTKEQVSQETRSK